MNIIVNQQIRKLFLKRLCHRAIYLSDSENKIYLTSEANHCLRNSNILTVAHGLTLTRSCVIVPHPSNSYNFMALEPERPRKMVTISLYSPLCATNLEPKLSGRG